MGRAKAMVRATAKAKAMVRATAKAKAMVRATAKATPRPLRSWTMGALPTSRSRPG
jgi:hypothetical protein